MPQLEDVTVDQELTCSACTETVERGYVPVVETDGPPEPLSELAVCDGCGWREVGHTGCAPELRDFDRGDILVRVETDDGGLVPAAVTDEL